MIYEPSPFDLFQHIRLIVGMVLSLSIARLLNGLGKFVQHPSKIHVYIVHMGWVFSTLLFLIHFWWWEFRLSHIQQWTFEAYLLIITYAILFFFLCALLFPDQMDEYSGYKDYFTSRRGWFFGIFLLTFIIDFGDTAVKGTQYFQSLGIEYPIRNITYIILCLSAIFVKNERFQIGFSWHH